MDTKSQNAEEKVTKSQTSLQGFLQGWAGANLGGTSAKETAISSSRLFSGWMKKAHHPRADSVPKSFEYPLNVSLPDTHYLEGTERDKNLWVGQSLSF